MSEEAPEAVQPEIENGMGALPYTVIKITGTTFAQPHSVSSGTGFFYRFTFDNNQVPVIVTNKHVVDGLDNLSFHFGLMRNDGKRVLGPAEVVTIQTSTFPVWRHPRQDVDIAIIPANPLLVYISKKGKKPFFLSMDEENLPPDWLVGKLLASTDILMVGFPNGLMDQANNLPLTRKGILATPYVADHDGSPNFVVDIAAFGGSSGSPVFAFFNGMAPTKDGMALGGSSVYLIGLLHSGPTVSSIGEVISVPVPTSKQISHNKLMMHLGYCAKIQLLQDFVPMLRGILKQEEENKLTLPSGK